MLDVALTYPTIIPTAILVVTAVTFALLWLGGATRH